MISTEQQQTTKGRIMIVDDNPANLKLLEDMLQQKNYHVRSFPRGQLALAAVALNPPDLILLDVNMPEMTGYEVCERLKSLEMFSAIPVLFISALNQTEDKVRGFLSGGVDYISKPFQFEEVHARVETHLKLRRAQQAERDLLDKTLGGAIRTLWDLVQLTSPALAIRSSAIRDIVMWIVNQLNLADGWQHELAATLCLVGCLALPDDVFARAWGGKELSPDERLMFQTHPETAARLISKIPRLEGVAEIILGQMGSRAEPAGCERSEPGGQILRLAVDLDQRVYLGASSGDALAWLRKWRQFDRRLLDALENYSPSQTDFEVRKLRIRDLRAGMRLRNDVFARGGMLILVEGTVLTHTWIQRLENFAKSQGISERLEVCIPKMSGLLAEGSPGD
jgi:response regulator RpfG family c-di-GMP phosphodiesterase